MKKKNFREKLRFYLIDIKTPIGKIIDVGIVLLNLLIVFLFVIETYTISEKTLSIIWNIELIVVGFFIVEYFARLYASEKRIKHIFNIYSIIDLIAILPTVILFSPLVVSANIGIIKIVRVFRVFRIFRFLRFTADEEFFFGKISTRVLKVIQLILTLLIIFFVSSGLFYAVESPINEQVSNFGDAFYYTVVTLTTVGFGDIIPVSDAGRWITVLMILSGIILIPWEASRIIKEWMHTTKQRDITCRKCGLKYHDRDASHCKSCGNVIYQVYEN